MKMVNEEIGMNLKDGSFSKNKSMDKSLDKKSSIDKSMDKSTDKSLDKSIDKSTDNQEHIVIIEDIKIESIIKLTKDERKIIFNDYKDKYEHMDEEISFNKKSKTPIFNETYFDDFNNLINKYLDIESYSLSKGILNELSDILFDKLCKYDFILPLVEIEQFIENKNDNKKIKLSHKKCLLTRYNKYVEYITDLNEEVYLFGIYIDKVIFDSYCGQSLNSNKIFAKHNQYDVMLMTNFVKDFLNGHLIASDRINMRFISNDSLLHFTHTNITPDELKKTIDDLKSTKNITKQFDKQVDVVSNEVIINIINKLFNCIFYNENYYGNFINSYLYDKMMLSSKTKSTIISPYVSNELNKYLHKRINTPYIKYPLRTDDYLNKSNLILDEMNSLYNSKMNLYNNTHYIDLSRKMTKTLSIYLFALTYGRKNKIVNNFIDSTVIAKQNRLDLHKIYNDKYIEYNKLSMIYNVITKIFSGKKLEDIRAKLKRKHNLKSIYGLFTDTDAKLIKNAVIRLEDKIKSIINNKCPHIKLLKKINMTVNNYEKKKLIYELASYFKNKIGDLQNPDGVKKLMEMNSFIECNNCGFHIMCPHKLLTNIMTIENKSFMDIKSVLNNFIDSESSTSNYFSQNIAVSNDHYHCKICSENIAADDDFDDFAIVRVDIDTNLNNLIMEEVGSISKYMYSTNLFNKKKLDKIIASNIYPFIFSTEKVLIKYKLDTDKEIKEKLRLYTNIYGWAYLINIVNTNKNLAIQTGKPLDNLNIEKKTIAYLEFAINTMLREKKYIIQQTNANAEFIKSRMIKAYKELLLKKSSNVIVQTTKYTDINFQTLIGDPIYSFIFAMYVIAEPKHQKLELDMITDYSLAEKVLSQSINIHNQKNTLISIYKNVDYKKTFASLGKFVPDKSMTVNEIYPYYLKYCYWTFIAHLQSRVFLNKLFTKSNAEISVSKDTASQFDEYYLKFQYENSKTYNVVLCSQSSKFKLTEFNIGALYDEKGNKQKWDIYIYESGEYTIKQLQDRLSAGEQQIKDIDYPAYNPLIGWNATNAASRFGILDKKNSKNGNKLSLVSKLNEKEIYDSINSKNLITNFFKYFKIRCLKKQLHLFVNHSCKWCGLKSSMIENPLSAESKDFFQKNKQHYSHTDNELSNLLQMKVINPNLIYKEMKGDLTEQFIFKMDTNVIKNISKEYSVNYNVLMLIGLCEGEKWSDITNGVIKQVMTNDLQLLRLLKVKSYILIFNDQYYKFKYYKTLINISKEYLKFIETNNIDINELRKLPLIDDITENKKYSVENQSLYLLNELYKIIDQLSKNKLYKLIIKFILDKIVKCDSNLSIANSDDIKIFNNNYITNAKERETEIPLDEQIDPENEPDDNMDEIEKETLEADGIVAEDTGNTDDPLSNNAFDVDDDNPDGDVDIEIHTDD